MYPPVTESLAISVYCICCTKSSYLPEISSVRCCICAAAPKHRSTRAAHRVGFAPVSCVCQAFLDAPGFELAAAVCL
eukprot:jgi/Ulvmu1/3754/UM175_0001.1